MENEIKVGYWIRDREGHITEIIQTLSLFKDVELYLGEDGYQYSDNAIVKHSSNLKDIIQKDDFVNKCRVYEVEEKGITVYQTVENSATDYNWISFDEIKEVVTKEQFESISYKVTKM